ncbi:extracellular solute-binding protein family 1 (plasmid) [Rhizobium freirei PRF 81]|uniref:Extracellular solute-binding protein family 1 n=1 Tax=Rhizobium freirei PRF 81 TaxID=363754 RepID=N6UY87_9HYPH|nr:extracellular solute-binding protein [Rhizobium freirei]ENN83837.1 extracellular solute-binding protein family 1 [Rhizobium freirei PRF 81]
MSNTIVKRRVGFIAGLLCVTALFGVAHADQTTITFFTANDAATVAVSEELAKDFEAANPDVHVEVEVGPGGTERDNLVRSRLATQSMNDVFLYNSGSLYRALNPAQTLVDLSNEPWQANIVPEFKEVVTAPDGTVRGAPIQTAMGGGIFYNIPLYKELGLSVPKSWGEFMANNAKIKAAGKVPVVQTYRDTWTSQLMVLGDNYNVMAETPDFASQYTAGKAKFASTPSALRSFQKLEELHAAGYLNEDFGAATLEDGLRMVATGEGAHYPMLSFAFGSIAKTDPDNLNNVGFFAIPGDDPGKNGLTIWLPNGLYIPSAGPNVEIAKRFVAFVASVKGCESQNKAAAVTGPYLVNGCELPAGVPRGVSDMLPYFKEAGKTGPALEFLSPVKGPSLEQITVEVGSGTRSAADGAALYDEDVRKQAQQLGLPGW